MLTRLTQAQVNKKIDFIKGYISAGNAADGSILDANANVTHKNIATLEAEINKDINIQVNRALVCEKIEEMYGSDLAKEYIRQLEAHEIYTHDETSLKPYCVSVSLYPFLIDGLTKLGGESKAPHHLESFCGSFVNLVFAISSQFAGAVATVEFLLYFDYFCRKDYGDDYLNTHRKTIENHLQHVVYAINQPAAARGYQSVFWNISLYDKAYFDSMFGTFVFPDMTAPSWEGLSKFQEFFLSWFNAERKKAILTFPVVTVAMLTSKGKPVDEDFAKLCASELHKGNSFFVYMSESADSLASCCFEGSEEITVNNKTFTIKEFVDGYDPDALYELDSINPITQQIEKTKIVNILKKSNEKNILIEVNVGGKINRVTPDHMYLVFDISKQQFVELQISEIIKNGDNYQFLCE